MEKLKDIFDELDNYFASIGKGVDNFRRNFAEIVDEAMKNLDGSYYFTDSKYSRSDYKKIEDEDDLRKWTVETWTEHHGLFKFEFRNVQNKDKRTDEVMYWMRRPSLDEIDTKMKEYADKMDYERAMELRGFREAYVQYMENNNATKS